MENSFRKCVGTLNKASFSGPFFLSDLYAHQTQGIVFDLTCLCVDNVSHVCTVVQASACCRSCHQWMLRCVSLTKTSS